MRHWLVSYSRSLQNSQVVSAQKYPIGIRESMWTVALLFVLAAMRALLTLPNFAVANWHVAQLGEGAKVLVGKPVISGDLAANFAQARALIEPTHGAYDELFRIFPLIGLNWDVTHGTPRLPTEIPLFVPIAALNYGSPVYQAAAYALPVIAILAMAWSLRLLDIPPTAAWLVTAILVVSPIGQGALESTYPFIAVALAVSWRFRNRPLPAAIGLLFAGAGRGIALITAFYFFAVRSWRTVLWLAAMLAVLLVTAVMFEPSVIADFLSRGLEWGRVNAARVDNASLASALVRPGYAYIIALVIFILSARRASSLYWALVWLAAALTPIAWTYAAVALLPLGGFLWSKGNVPRVCVAVAVVVLVANGSYAGLTYAVIVLLLGIGLVAASWNSDQIEPSDKEEEARERA